MNEASNITFIDLYYKGFHIGVTARGENEIPSGDDLTKQAKEAKMAIDALQGLEFEPSWNKDTNKASQASTPVKSLPDLGIDGPQGQGGTCPVHGTALVWKTGTNAKGQYAFWACPTKNADGSYCKAATKKN